MWLILVDRSASMGEQFAGAPGLDHGPTVDGIGGRSSRLSAVLRQLGLPRRGLPGGKILFFSTPELTGPVVDIPDAKAQDAVDLADGSGGGLGADRATGPAGELAADGGADWAYALPDGFTAPGPDGVVDIVAALDWAEKDLSELDPSTDVRVLVISDLRTTVDGPELLAAADRLRRRAVVHLVLMDPIYQTMPTASVIAPGRVQLAASGAGLVSAFAQLLPSVGPAAPEPAWPAAAQPAPLPAPLPLPVPMGDAAPTPFGPPPPPAPPAPTPRPASRRPVFPRPAAPAPTSPAPPSPPPRSLPPMPTRQTAPAQAPAGGPPPAPAGPAPMYDEEPASWSPPPGRDTGGIVSRAKEAIGSIFHRDRPAESDATGDRATREAADLDRAPYGAGASYESDSADSPSGSPYGSGASPATETYRAGGAWGGGVPYGSGAAYEVDDADEEIGWPEGGYPGAAPLPAGAPQAEVTEPTATRPDVPQPDVPQPDVPPATAAQPGAPAGAPAPQAPMRSGTAGPGAVPDQRSGPPTDGVAERLSFTVAHPPEMAAGAWHSLLFVLYRSGLRAAVDELLSSRAADLGGEPAQSTTAAAAPVARGTVLTLVPNIPGVACNPPKVDVAWYEDVQETTFRLCPDQDGGPARIGSIEVYAGPLLLAVVPLAIRVVATALATPARPEVSHARAIDRVFASYSRRDAWVVDACAAAYQALGVEVLIDRVNLRSGETWRDSLHALIARSDIFQLYWSGSSAESSEVENEWRFASSLADRGGRFIRPMFWETPMPAPPEELSHLHFSRIELEQIGALPS